MSFFSSYFRTSDFLSVTSMAPSEFVDLIELALQVAPADRRAGEDKLLELYTWDSLADRIHGLIRRKLETPLNSPETAIEAPIKLD